MGGGGPGRREKEKKLFMVLRPWSVLTCSSSRADDIVSRSNVASHLLCAWLCAESTEMNKTWSLPLRI